eukprot:TRINITY_DN88008_c1_g1_i1.p1 TRINITY_DN88008_c1_g1~~TRINITY_DN88008_c1_g1_i1.p1  ORF type:complete len:515 (-),score=34.86 TRINITY_DN88008_c1_g1_i1:491-2035(-)
MCLVFEYLDLRRDCLSHWHNLHLFLHGQNIYNCLYFSRLKLLVETVTYIIIFAWAYVAFSLTSYFSEYNERYSFYRNMKTALVSLLIQAISQEKEQWQNLLNKLPLGVVVTKNGHIKFANEECLRIFGQDSEPLVLTSNHFAQIKNVDGNVTMQDLIADHSKLQEAENKQFTYERAPTEKSYYSIRHSDITFKGHSMTAILLQDQTPFEELKKLDEKYQRIYLASVVHDIRTPLNGILGMIEVINQYPLSPEVKTYLRAAQNSAKLLLSFTFDITDFSQIQAKTLSVTLAPFTPAQVADECMQLLSFNFERKGIMLVKQVQESVPEKIVSDKNRYTQIVLNLLGNALKFTQHGQVAVSLSYSAGNDQLTTSVSDTGVGIKEGDIPKLFKLYGKIRENDEINPTGVGLGLAICKNLTEYLGGEITVSSRYGEGSTFTFTVACHLLDGLFPQTEFPIEIADEWAADSSRDFLRLISAKPMQPKVVIEEEEEVRILTWHNWLENRKASVGSAFTNSR